ncbi:hypothetical protein PSTG_09595 [Puccinia striiformis f. sp. tritici PST-78]|nr:hypothetical protein PSTG_09595 [Puccinia striiformis f. sp. tritici PST-78]
MFAISIVLLIQGKGAYSQSFGCSGNVKDHPFSGCVKHIYRQSKVDIMIAPWDNVVGAYDCSNTQHKKPTCCSNKSDMPATMDNIVWKRNCKEINGADIK